MSRILLYAASLFWVVCLVVCPTAALNSASEGIEHGVIVPVGTDLEVTKTCNSAGVRPICTVTVRNNGPVTAESVVVVEDPPDGTFARRVGTCFGSNSIGVAVPIDNIAIGDVVSGQQLTCSFEMTGASGVSINFVEVTSSTQELVPENNSATVTFVITAFTIPTLDGFGLVFLIVVLAGAGLVGLRWWRM